MIKKILPLIFVLFIMQCTSQKIETKKSRTEEHNKENLEHESIHKQEWEKHNKGKIFSENTLNKISLSSIEVISKDINEKFAFPKFTHDGNKLLFALENFNGIWIYDFEKETIQQLNSLPGSGYKFEISADGTTIYFRNKTQKGNDRRSIYTIVEQKIDSKKMNILYTSTYAVSPPVLIDKKLFFLENDKPKVLDLTSKKVTGEFKEPYFFVVNNKLYKHNGNGNEEIALKNIKPVSLKYTEDKKNIICLTATKGLLLLDDNGIVINNYPKAVSLSKLPGSNLVVFAEETDDGKRITKSEIYIGFTNSAKKNKLEGINDKIVFNPVWSPNKNMIAFISGNGKVKTITLNIKNQKEEEK